MITEHELGTYCVFFLVLHTQKKLVACVNYGIRNDVHDFQDKHVEKTKWNYVIIVIFFGFWFGQDWCLHSILCKILNYPKTKKGGKTL